MKHLIKIIALISALCLVLGMLSGCKASAELEIKAYSDEVDVNATLENVQNGVIAENEYYKMVWNKSVTAADGTEFDRASIDFISKKDGTVWSTTPTEYTDTTDASKFIDHGLVNSALAITVRNVEQTFSYNSYQHSVVNGRFSSVEREEGNGLSVTFYFDEIGVVITVDYYLEDDAFKVSIDPKEVLCYEIDDVVQNIINITPAPFVCGAQNTENGSKDSYVVVPSGSGAVMYLDQRTDNSVREFSGKVYGEDPTIDKWDNPRNETPITMPFYGIKKGDKGLCAIIEQAAESCELYASVGDSAVGVDTSLEKPGRGYSYVSAAYNVLGYNAVYAAGTWRLQYSEVVDANVNPLVIGYYPLSGDQADYTGMAKRYQKYLTEKEGMTKSQDNSLLNVKLFGSYIEDDLFVGIPTKKKVPLTTYSEATTILGELKELSGGSIVADMYGYGEGGINNTKLAGNYKLTGIVGNKTDLKNFVEYTESNGIKTFFNFDTVKFYASTAGYSINSDAALNINGIPAPLYQFLSSTRDRFVRSKGGKVGTLIAREYLAEVNAKAVETAGTYGISGMAFDTLGSTCYSDYTTPKENKFFHKYPCANDMGKDVKAVAKNAKDNSKSVLMDGAFAYAAVASDVITNAPTASNRDNSIDLDVPLYQIVFQGYRANSVSAINTATNQRTQFLKSIETGSGLSFDLMANYYQDLRKQYVRGLHASLYDDNKALIEKCVKESKDYLTSVAGATIKTHSYVTDKVTKTEFDNGVIVYVNYGNTDYASDIGTVKAQSFLNK